MNTRIKLIEMNDPYPFSAGSLGTIVGMDINGDLEIIWDCGSSLKLIPSVDQFQIISGETPKSHQVIMKKDNQ